MPISVEASADDMTDHDHVVLFIFISLSHVWLSYPVVGFTSRFLSVNTIVLEKKKKKKILLKKKIAVSFFLFRQIQH